MIDALSAGVDLKLDFLGGLSADIRLVLDHIGVESEPPLWEDCDAHTGQGTQVGPDWDLAAQPTSERAVENPQTALVKGVGCSKPVPYLPARG